MHSALAAKFIRSQYWNAVESYTMYLSPTLLSASCYNFCGTSCHTVPSSHRSLFDCCRSIALACVGFGRRADSGFAFFFRHLHGGVSRPCQTPSKAYDTSHGTRAVGGPVAIPSRGLTCWSRQSGVLGDSESHPILGTPGGLFCKMF